MGPHGPRSGSGPEEPETELHRLSAGQQDDGEEAILWLQYTPSSSASVCFFSLIDLVS